MKKKGTNDVTDQVAVTQQGAGNTALDEVNQPEAERTVRRRTARARSTAKPAGATKDKPRNNHNDADAGHNAVRTKAAKSTRSPGGAKGVGGKAKRLTPIAVKRLRGEDPLRETAMRKTAVGELIDAFIPKVHRKATEPVKPKQPALAATSYEYGYQAGFMAGEEEQRQQHRVLELIREGLTPERIRCWQAAALIMAGVIVGMLIGVIS